jgi:hypothetical protein
MKKFVLLVTKNIMLKMGGVMILGVLVREIVVVIKASAVIRVIVREVKKTSQRIGKGNIIDIKANF